MYASIKTIQPHAMIPNNGDIIDGDIIDGVVNITIVVPNSKEYKLQIQIKDIRYYDKAEDLIITLADNILYIHKDDRIISWDLSRIVHSNVRTDEIYFCHKKNIKNIFNGVYYFHASNQALTYLQYDIEHNNYYIVSEYDKFKKIRTECVFGCKSEIPTALCLFSDTLYICTDNNKLYVCDYNDSFNITTIGTIISSSKIKSIVVAKYIILIYFDNNELYVINNGLYNEITILAIYTKYHNYRPIMIKYNDFAFRDTNYYDLYPIFHGAVLGSIVNYNLVERLISLIKNKTTTLNVMSTIFKHCYKNWILEFYVLQVFLFSGQC